MTLEECYAQMDGDLCKALAVMETRERLARYLARFADDPTARLLFASMREGRMDDAFRAAHTLKGLCAGLGLTHLGESCSRLTGALRAGAAGEALLRQVKDDYKAAVRAIGGLNR